MGKKGNTYQGGNSTYQNTPTLSERNIVSITCPWNTLKIFLWCFNVAIHSSHNHVCTWQKLDRMRIPKTGTQHSDNSRWCDWLGTCHMNVRVWFQCTTSSKNNNIPPTFFKSGLHKHTTYSHLWWVFQWKLAIIWSRHSTSDLCTMCPMEHMFAALWTLSTTVLQAPIHDLWIEWKKVLSSFVSEKKEKKVLSKYYSLFHFTSEALECPVVVVFCPFDTLCSMPPSANGIWR